jgi:nitrate/nitrite transporter NarK
VSYLKLEHALSLAVAAGILSASQVLSVLTRIMWGQVSDRWITPTRLLGLLGVAMAIAAALLGSLPADAPSGLMLTAALGCAATSMAWNGVFFADLAHRVPAAQLATVTGGTQFLTFCGAMIGPVAFSSLVGPLGSHGATYIALALAPLTVGLWLLAGSRQSDE